MVNKRGRGSPVGRNERRKRGTCVKNGLDELGDLDAAAPPRVSARVETKPDAAGGNSAAERSVAADDLKTDAARAPTGDDNLVSSLSFSSPSSCGPPPTVFGHNWEEWKRVKRLLFHAHDDVAGASGARRGALDHIQRVWQARARGNRPLPAYVEATALLVEAKSLDEEDRLSSFGAVTFYGAAISRALHLMTGTFARGADDTYRKRARAIGLPEEAVEVRQRVAHGTLPLLSELRWVCGLVLQFLFQRYWVVQEHHVRVMEEEERREEKSNATDADGTNDQPPTATVEEMRRLLEELSDGSGADDTDGLKDSVEVLEGGWQLC